MALAPRVSLTGSKGRLRTSEPVTFDVFGAEWAAGERRRKDSDSQ